MKKYDVGKREGILIKGLSKNRKAFF